jgi:hypothetical protein
MRGPGVRARCATMLVRAEPTPLVCVLASEWTVKRGALPIRRIPRMDFLATMALVFLLNKPGNAQEAPMPQSAHARAAEFHLLAAHAHESAANHHGKGDHLSGHEASRQAHEHAKQAWQWTQTAQQKSAAAKGIPATGDLPFGQSAPHESHDEHAVSGGFNPTLTSSSAAKALGLPETKPAAAKKSAAPKAAASAKKPTAKKSAPAAAPKRKK